MKDYLISQFIDNELDFDEKIEFIETVHKSYEFTQEAKEFLEQEKQIRLEIKPWVPSMLPVPKRHSARLWFVRSWWQPAAGFAAALFIFAIISPFRANLTLDHDTLPELAQSRSTTVSHRFVLLQEGSTQVEITGSFTHWKKVALVPTGAGGYWEITLPVTTGEHRYSFIVDGTQLLPDPSAATQEPDDFGAINSILNVEVQT